MLNPTLQDGPAEVALMTDMQKKVVKSIYLADRKGLRLWQVQKKVEATKREVQDALRELLTAGYIGILSMGGGPKYHKVASKTYILDTLNASNSQMS